MPDNQRQKYFNTLGFREGNVAAKDSLNRAYQLRTFEIEHYWKRGTYFWGFQIAIFGAFGFLWEKNANLALVLAALGILTSLANSLSVRGSIFWQKNWERHIDMLEDRLEGRLYKTIWITVPFGYSVSRINRVLVDYFVIFWIIAFSYSFLRFVGIHWPEFEAIKIAESWCWSWVFYLGVVVTFVFGGAVQLLRQRSKLDGTWPTNAGCHDHDRKFDGPQDGQSQGFIRRYAPDDFS